MNLDTLGRESGESVTHSASTGLDPDVMLARLESTHRRRVRARIVLSGVAAAALVTVGWVALQPGSSDTRPVLPSQRDRQGITPQLPVHPTPSPVSTSVHNGPVALMDASGDVISVEDRFGGGETSLVLDSSSVDGQVDNTSFSWSLDGSRLTFAAQAAGATRLVQVDPTTGEQDVVHVCPSVCSGRLSPDQQWLALADSTEKWSRLLLVELSTGNERILFKTASAKVSHPSWAPDGTALAFLESTDDTSRVLTVQAVGDEAPMVLAEGSAQYAPAWPEWSPKGSWVAFLQAQPPFKSLFVTVVPFDGGPATALFPVGERDMGSPEDIHRLFHERFGTLSCNYGDAGTPESVAWSPDGTSVVVRSCAGTFVALAEPNEPPTFIAWKTYSNPDDPPDFGAAAWRPVP